MKEYTGLPGFDDLTVKIVRHDSVAVMRVSGEIDSTTVQSIRTPLHTLVEERPAGLILDLNEVRFFGSAGIAIVVEAAQLAHQRGITFAVATRRRCVLRPLHIGELHRMVTIHPDTATALGTVIPTQRTGT